MYTTCVYDMSRVYDMCIQHVYTTCAYDICIQHMYTTYIHTTCVYDICIRHNSLYDIALTIYTKHIVKRFCPSHSCTIYAYVFVSFSDKLQHFISFSAQFICIGVTCLLHFINLCRKALDVAMFVWLC